MTIQSHGAQSAQNSTYTINLTDAQKAAFDAKAAALDLSPDEMAAAFIIQSLNAGRPLPASGKESQILKVDFSHRLGARDYSGPENIGDIIGLMNERASGVLCLALNALEDDSTNIKTVCLALYSVLEELNDIEETVRAYHSVLKKKKNNTAPPKAHDQVKFADLAQQSKEQFTAILRRIEEVLTTYQSEESVSLELALHEVSRMACDGHAIALELHSKLNREGV